MGIVYNTFSERLAQLIDESQVPNLAVVTSASPGQQSWASADLRGSAFGRYFKLAVAGFADVEGGDADGDVSLQELVAYLQAHVADWSWANRAERQMVQLLPKSTNDFRIAWSLKGDMQAMRETFESQSAITSPISVSQISGLWKQLDDLRSYEPIRYDPLVSRDLEHRLLELEQLASAGSAYRDRAKREYESLRGDLTRIADRGARLDGSRL